MDLVLRLDAEGRILYASSASRSMLGYEPDELRHRHSDGLIHPEDLAWVAVQMEALHRGEEVCYGTRVRHRDGAYVQVEVQAYPLRAPDTGALHEVQAIWRVPHTEADPHLLVKRLGDERDHLYQVLMKAPAFIATLRGPDHVFEYVNERYYELVGQRDLIGRPIRVALPEVLHQDYPALLDWVFRTGEVFEGHELPVELQRTPGAAPEVRYIDLVYQPLRRPDGAPFGILAHGVDVTEQVLVRQRLEVLRQIDRAILAMRTPETIARATLAHLVAFTGATRAVLLLFDEEKGEGRVLAGYPDEGRSWFADGRMRFPLAGTPSPWWTRTVYVDDLAARDAPLPPIGGALRDGLRSLLAIPLGLHDECTGCLTLASDEPNAFTPYERFVTEETAATLAMALQSARLLEMLQTSQEHLRSLSRRLVRVQEEERRHLALELHDEIGQQLLSVNLALEQAATQAEPHTREPLERAARIVEKLTSQVRTLSLDLRPSLLDDLGLLAALSWYLHRYTEQTGITVDFKHAGLADRRFPFAIETTAYRIVQEAMTNAARYAATDRITVKALLQGSLLLLRVQDFGAGFDLAGVEASGGLSGMRERIALVGGELVVEAAPGRGVTIIASIPVDTEDTHDLNPAGRRP